MGIAPIEVAQHLPKLARGFVVLSCRVRNRQRVGAEIGHIQFPQELAPIGMGIGSHAPLARGRKRSQLRNECAVLVEERFRLIAAHPGFKLSKMLRHRQATGSTISTRLLYSSRSYEEVIYREALDRLSQSDTTLEVYHTLTRAQPPNWTGYRRRIDQEMLREVAWSPEQHPLTYVCGPTQLVESVAAELVALGHEGTRVKTERFGPTGGA
jgi:NAD(P)H-flavin reductase